MKKHFLAMLGMAALLGGTTVNASHGNKDAATIEHSVKKRVADVSRFVGSGTANPHKYIKTPKANQRQYRKLLRQCPHLRHSKKCRLKR